MPNRDDIWEENRKGRFYVDKTCIDCYACRITAPDTFAQDENTPHSYVKMQPANPEQVAKAEEARDNCPVLAIGDDGYEEKADENTLLCS